MASSTLDLIQNPTWLLDPPTVPTVPPPVTTRAQILPLSQLGWKDFERLCLRLARIEGEAEHWQLYGNDGQKQGGIDIYVRSPGIPKYRVWQVKRYQKITASDIRKAVATFLKGNWVERSDRFILCTSASIDATGVAEAIETATATLRQKNIDFDVRGDAKLSEIIKAFPAIVDDFFDRAWTERFCGVEAAKELGSRLSRSSYAALRQRLHHLYSSHFATVDPGVLRSTVTMAQPAASLPLAKRFVAPDFSGTETKQNAPIEELAPENSVADEWEDDGFSLRRVRRQRPRRPTSPRLGLEQWAAQSERTVLFGSPGSGKSTLLRFLSLDLLSEEPRFAYLKRRWPGHLPLVLSFPFWTRLIQGAPSGTAISVPKAIASWLEAHAEPELAAMALNAFEQRQVLLLVDGVDEWADEQSATTALTLLQTFVETRNIPSVITSRPHGAKLLGILNASWRRHLIAPFSLAQQTEFAEAWYEFLDEQDGRVPGSSRSRAQAFVSKLQALTDVATLAGTPLLFSGLMALDREGAVLPRNRFQAYRELSDRLMTIQPQARAQAAMISRGSPTLDASTRELVLAELAFRIQSNRNSETGLDAIGKNEAIEFCRDAICRHLELPREVARARAQELLNVGAETLGLLVEKSQSTIGFLHRAFQELLAARFIDGLSLEDQCALMRDHSHDPQWRDILLFTTQYASRTADVEALVAAIESAPSGAINDWWRSLLLADIAFGEVRRTPQFTRRLAQSLFDIVETGLDLDQRSEILKRVVAGLSADQTAVMVKPKLRSWFPRFHAYNAGSALQIVAAWNDPDINGILWRNLESEDTQCRNVAADELARRHGGDEGWLERIISYLGRAANLTAASSAIRLLDLGWPEEARARTIVDLAARHDDAEIARAGMTARIRNNRQDEEDRDRLIGWMRKDRYLWSEVSADLLPVGWPHDETLKTAVLEGLQSANRQTDQCIKIAASAFAGDEEITSALIGLFEQRPSAAIRHNAALLAKNFAGNVQLAHSFSGGGKDGVNSAFYHAHGAKIAATPQLKSDLLNDLGDEQNLRFWAVDALLDHWPDDAEVTTALNAVFSWPDADCARVADRLAQIEPHRPDLVEQRLRGLVQAAEQDHRIMLTELVSGLIGIDAFTRDLSLIDALLDIIDSRNPDSLWVDGALFTLLQLGPIHPRLESLIRDSLRTNNGMIGIAALRFSSSPDIRTSVLEVLAPLPLPLRLVIAEALKDRGIEDQWAQHLLEEGSRDAEGGLATLCEIRAARNRLASQTVDAAYVGHLGAEMKAIGIHFDQRRLAAFFSLITAGCLDEAASRVALLEHASLSMASNLRGWTEIDASVAEVWPTAAKILQQHGGIREKVLGPDEVVEQFAPFSEGRPELRSLVQEAVQALGDRGESSIPVLRFHLQDPVNRPDVLERCLPLLGNGRSWNDISRSLDAADLVSHHFPGNALVYDHLKEALGQGLFIGPVAALCDGWPDSEALETVFVNLKSDRDYYRDLMFTPVALKIMAVKSAAEIVEAQLAAMAVRSHGDLWDGVPHWAPTILRRVKRDPGLQQMMFQRLNCEPPPGVTVTFASYLTMANGMTPDLEACCTRAIERSVQQPLVESGMDLWLGENVIVWKRLSDLLRADGRL